MEYAYVNVEDVEFTAGVEDFDGFKIYHVKTPLTIAEAQELLWFFKGEDLKDYVKIGQVNGSRVKTIEVVPHNRLIQV